MYIWFVLAYLLPMGGAKTECTAARCGEHGPLIRRPFRLEHKQPQHCGYPHPSFDLHCNEHNHTLFQLPSSSTLVTVDKIDYGARKLYLSDPQKCFPEKLPSLNLSTSPFDFSPNYESYLLVDDFILFNCSVSRHLYHSIPCLSGSSYRVYAISRLSSLTRSDLTSCTNIGEISSVPADVFLREQNHLNLTWSKQVDGGKTNGAALAGASLGFCLFMTIFGSLYLLYLSLKADRENERTVENFLKDYEALKPTRFSYWDIKRITNQFNEKLGEGGYGIVYKGKISNEVVVAVKVLNNSKENGEDFVNEVGTIGRIHHVNIVRLLGFCAQGFHKALVYEFLPNGSLEKLILNRDVLGWEKMHDIALGIAKGIEYLHGGCDQQILHFDIKPHNIMIDHNFKPKICDFGLAKLCSKEQSGVTMTAARGTMGYIAPEVLSRTFGRVSYKSDVYSFGMLLLEIVGGRKNVDAKREYSPQWIYNQLDIRGGFWEKIGNIGEKISIVGLWCIQWHPNDRPAMKMVVQMLEGDIENIEKPPNPFPDNERRKLYESELVECD